MLSRRLQVAKPEVALTFDDGPAPIWTPRILALLSQHAAHATFFVLGSQIERHPGIVVAAARAGDEIEDHGLTHRSLPSMAPKRITQELSTTADLIEELTGARPTFVRPPYGNLNGRVVAAAKALGMRVALWTIDTRDWANPGANVIARRALQNLAPGDIILLHDGGGGRAQTVQAVARILAALDARGYRAVTLHHLVQDAIQGEDPGPSATASGCG